MPLADVADKEVTVAVCKQPAPTTSSSQVRLHHLHSHQSDGEVYSTACRHSQRASSQHNYFNNITTRSCFVRRRAPAGQDQPLATKPAHPTDEYCVVSGVSLGDCREQRQSVSSGKVPLRTYVSGSTGASSTSCAAPPTAYPQQ
jgi:hypothetical protein